MNVAEENAIRCIARQCRDELKQAHENNPIALHAELDTAILDEYAKKFAKFRLPDFKPKRWLQWYVMQIDKESL